MAVGVPVEMEEAVEPVEVRPKVSAWIQDDIQLSMNGAKYLSLTCRNDPPRGGYQKNYAPIR